MGLFGPSYRKIRQQEIKAQIQWEVQERQRKQQSLFANPPREPLDRSIDWVFIDAGWLPILEVGLLNVDSGDLGVMLFGPAHPQIPHRLREDIPNVSLFVEGSFLRSAHDDGGLLRDPNMIHLRDIEVRIPASSILFHYHFDLHPEDVSAEAFAWFNDAWPAYLKDHSWGDFRKALHAGSLPGAPSWWRELPLEVEGR